MARSSTTPPTTWRKRLRRHGCLRPCLPCSRLVAACPASEDDAGRGAWCTKKHDRMPEEHMHQHAQAAEKANVAGEQGGRGKKRRC